MLAITITAASNPKQLPRFNRSNRVIKQVFILLPVNSQYLRQSTSFLHVNQARIGSESSLKMGQWRWNTHCFNPHFSQLFEKA
jgi:hypothetical protein